MAKKQKPNLINSSGLILPLSFFTLLATNFVVLYFANLLFPREVVLGTYFLSSGWAIFHSMILLTLVDTFIIPVVHYHESVRGSMYSSKEWMLLYFVLNSLAVWVIARFANNLGFGISAWWVALFLGAAFDWLQGLAMMALGKLTE